jgi:hypothetical protein
MEPENHADTEQKAGTHNLPEPLAAAPEAAVDIPEESEQSIPPSDETEVGGLPADASPQTDFESAPEPGSIEDFSRRARGTRLSPEEEREAAARLSELLLGGRADVTRALQSILVLPWMITSQGATQAWPEMKPTFRSQLLAGLARTPGEPAARVRLSLARGLFKVDPAASLKLIILTLRLLRNKETGLLQGRGPQIFANVLIGKGKAWLLQLPVDSLKPAELDLLASCALHGAFHAPQSPLTQIGVLRWAAKWERLSKIPEALDQLILRAIQRWSGKWKSVLQKEVQPLPESWFASLKKSPADSSRSEPSDEGLAQEDMSGANPETRVDYLENEGATRGPATVSPRKSRRSQTVPEAQTMPLPFGESAAATQEASEEHLRDGEEEDTAEDAPDPSSVDAYEGNDETDTEEAPRRRPVYESKTIPRFGGSLAEEPNAQPRTVSGRRGGAFNLQETLRQIENHVQGLKSELAIAQKQLRHRDEDKRMRRPERPMVIPGEPSAEELHRLNQQLEFRNAELRARIEELTVDSEQRAASRNLSLEAEPSPDGATELRVLLGLKLREDFEDFQALEQEKKDLIVQQHYRSLLQHIFEVLSQEGVSFEAAPPAP